MSYVGPVVTCCMLLSLASASLAFADEQTLSSLPCELRIATGKRGKGFAKLFRDIEAVCASQVQVCEVETEGGLQNLTVLSSNQADVGFAQIDTLQQMRDSDENIAALKALLPVNSNLLHIVARSGGYAVPGEKKLGFLWRDPGATVVVRKFSDLKGLPVAVVGSAQLMARMLDKELGYRMRFTDLETDDEAVAKLLAGEVAALLSMSGWPSGTLGTLRPETGLTFVTYDLAARPPQRLVRKNYPNLGVFNNVFLAGANLLVTRPFKPTGTQGKYVSALKSCIVENLTALQEGAFDPGWKEIKDIDESYGWPRFEAVTNAMTPRSQAARVGARASKEVTR